MPETWNIPTRPSHRLAGMGNHIAAFSKYFSGNYAPQGSEDFSVGNSVVTPISEKTAKVLQLLS